MTGLGVTSGQANEEFSEPTGRFALLWAWLFSRVSRRGNPAAHTSREWRAVSDRIVHILRSYPELAIFLTLGLGCWFGALRSGSLSLGAVTGVLLAGILVGPLDIQISSQVQFASFIMFLFAVRGKETVHEFDK
jgi:hypothetical protein